MTTLTQCYIHTYRQTDRQTSFVWQNRALHYKKHVAKRSLKVNYKNIKNQSEFARAITKITVAYFSSTSVAQTVIVIMSHLNLHWYNNYTGVQHRTHSGFGEILGSGSCGETHDGANCFPSVTDVPIARTTIPDSPSRSKN